jgi:hypothetical protein
MKIYLLLLMCFSASFAQNKLSNEEYIYPITSDKKEWKELKTQKEMLSACQIPAEKLAKMSTKALVKACLDYPMFGDFTAFNTPQLGFDVMAKGFNGLQEICKRKDAGCELLAVYKEGPDNWSKYINMRYGILFSNFIELVLSQNSILKNTDKKCKKDIVKIAEEYYRDKKTKPERYSDFGLSPSVLLIARVMDSDSLLEKEKSEDADIKSFLRDGSLKKIETMDSLVSKAKSLNE